MKSNSRVSLFLFLFVWQMAISAGASIADLEKEPFHNPAVNQILQEQFDAIYQPSTSDDGHATLTWEEAKSLYEQAINNRVATLKRVGRYDPTGEIGFCYGRALTVELIARKMKLARSGIRKLFIIGDLRSNPSVGEWRFHVTTLTKVRGLDNKISWYAIDPIMYRGGEYAPLTVSRWIEMVRDTWDSWQGFSKAKLYLTQNAAPVLPDIRNIARSDYVEGNQIIDLSFDPIKNGIKIADEEDHVNFGIPREQQPDTNRFRFYLLDQNAGDQFFLSTEEPSLPDRFNFLGLHLEEFRYFGYYGYFIDLFSTLL